MKPTVESQYRLKKWCTLGKGENAEWLYKGAMDGKKYFKENSNDYQKLMNSYNYEWIKLQFKSLYPEQILD